MIVLAQVQHSITHNAHTDADRTWTIHQTPRFSFVTGGPGMCCEAGCLKLVIVSCTISCMRRITDDVKKAVARKEEVYP